MSFGLIVLSGRCLEGLSNHFPLMLNTDIQNWGPLPQRMLKCWAYLPGYHDYVISHWIFF